MADIDLDIDENLVQQVSQVHVVCERLQVGGALRLRQLAHDRAELDERVDVLHVDRDMVLDDDRELAQASLEGRQIVAQGHEFSGECRLRTLRQSDHFLVDVCKEDTELDTHVRNCQQAMANTLSRTYRYAL